MIRFNVKLTEAEASNFVDILTKNPVLINKITDSVYSSGIRKGIAIGALSVVLGLNTYIWCLALNQMRKQNKQPIKGLNTVPYILYFKKRKQMSQKKKEQ